MNKEAFKVVTEYIARLFNALSGAIATIALTMLVKDGNINVENVAMGSTLLIVSIVSYFVGCAIVVVRTKMLDQNDEVKE